MSFLEGFMWLGANEVFNNGRTLTNVRAAQAAGLFPNIHFDNEEGCDCAAYQLDPTIELGPFTALLACMGWDVQGLPCEALDASTLNSIDEINPWHDDNIDASDDFLGVWVISVEGLDGRHNARNATPRPAFPRGSILGPLQPTHRTVSYEFTLLATTDCGLDYGMEWLEKVLAQSCEECGLDVMYVRSCCPPEDDPDYGLWVLREAGLCEGPEWNPPIDSGMAKYMRDGHVSICAGNPCRWSKRETCLDWTPLWTSTPSAGFPVGVGSVGALGTVCCLVPAPSMVYDYAPVITIEASNEGDTLPFTVKAYENLAYGSYPPGTAPCAVAGDGGSGDVVLSIGVASLPSGHTLVLDGAERKIIFFGPTTNFEEVDGSAYIDATAGFIQWAVLCGTAAAVKVRVADAVLTDALAAFSLSSGPRYATPRVLIELVKRGGC